MATAKPRKSASISIEDDGPMSVTRSGRQSRISRLAPPSRASGRSMSANRPNNVVAGSTGKSPNTSTSSQLLRPPVTRSSRSVCATPLRTPIRASSAPPATVEKERRANNQELAVQLVEKLHTHPQFRTEYLPNGLRAITTKQFVNTIVFFMRSVVGNARGQKLPADIGTDDIGKWLAQIRYPHLQSRSWLKTPNVPHAFHHLVELINWLASFIPEDPDDPMPSFRRPENHLNSEQFFPSTAYVCSFLTAVLDMFVMWNQDEDCDTAKRRLIADFVQQRRPQLPDAINYIATDLQRLQREIDDLGGSEGTAVISDNVDAAEAALDRDTKQMHANEADDEKILELCRTTSASYHAMQTEHQAQLRHEQQIKIQLKRVSERLNAQRMSASERDELLHCIQQQRDAIAAEKAAITQLRTAGHEKHLAYTSSLKRQNDVCSAVQQRVHAIGEVLQSKELLDWSLDSRSGTEVCGPKLQQLQRRFEVMRTDDEESMPMLRNQDGDLGGELSALRAEVAVKEAIRDELAASTERLKERRSHLDELMGMTRVDFAKKRTELGAELVNMAERLEKCDVRLGVERERLVEMVATNERKMEEVKRVATRMINAKLEGLKEGYDLLAELKGLISKAQVALDKIDI